MKLVVTVKDLPQEKVQRVVVALIATQKLYFKDKALNIERVE